MSSTCKYIGIDGCRAGWFYVALGDGDEYQFGVLEKFKDVERFLPTAELILVDIPIGLPSAGQPGRLCDREARKMISPRGSSVFPAPARSALNKATYEEGSEENFRVLGRRLSKQTWNIVPKIREVDEFLRSVRPGRKIREMHPEVAFSSLNSGVPVRHNKKKPEGRNERMALLTKHWRIAEKCYEDAVSTFPRKRVARDDIVDAMVGLVLASQPKKLASLPKVPLVDEKGFAMEIVKRAWRDQV